jgi:hypothetical protein
MMAGTSPAMTRFFQDDGLLVTVVRQIIPRMIAATNPNDTKARMAVTVPVSSMGSLLSDRCGPWLYGDGF